MTSLEKQIAASGIEPWSETEEEDEQDESSLAVSHSVDVATSAVIDNYLNVRQDAGIGQAAAEVQSKKSIMMPRPTISEADTNRIIQSNLKGILKVK